MPTVKAFLDLCRRVSIETDPVKLQDLKGALQFMLQTKGIDFLDAEIKCGLGAN
jgi:hypothetical protein